MSEYINVDLAFNPELRQAQSDFDAYQETRPIEDQNGQIRRPDGTFYSKDKFSADMDAARESHFDDVTLSYGELSFTELERKLFEAEDHGDKTIAGDVTEAIFSKLNDLSISELAGKLAEAEISNNEIIAGGVTDVILDKLSDLHEKNKTDRHEDGIASQDNMLDRVLRLKDNKKQALLGDEAQPDQSEPDANAAAPGVHEDGAEDEYLEGVDGEAAEDGRDDWDGIVEFVDEEEVDSPNNSSSDEAGAAESEPQLNNKELQPYLKLEHKVNTLVDQMAELDENSDEFIKLYKEFNATYDKFVARAQTLDIDLPEDLYENFLDAARIDLNRQAKLDAVLAEQEEAEGDEYFERDEDEEGNEEQSEGRLNRFTGKLRSAAFKAGLLGAGAYAYLKQAPARSKWINEKMPESWSPRTKNIVKGVGGVVVLGALAWAVKETAFDGNEVSVGDTATVPEMDMNLDSLIEMEEGVTPEDVTVDTTEGLPEGIDEQAGAVGDDGEVTSVAPEAEADNSGSTGSEAAESDDATGEGNSGQEADASSPEAELNTDVLQVEDESGFIESFQGNYDLSNEQAHEAYESMKPSLAGAEGTYTVGTDIRISSSGGFELPEAAQKKLEDYLRSIGKM